MKRLLLLQAVLQVQVQVPVLVLVAKGLPLGMNDCSIGPLNSAFLENIYDTFSKIFKI